MLSNPTFLPTLIAAGSSKRILDGKGTTILCLDGHVWITQAGDVRDVVLARGQSFTLDRDGLALLVALDQPAVADLIRPAEAAATAALATLDAGRGAVCPSPAVRREALAVGAWN